MRLSEFPHALLQPIELLDFKISECPIENGKIIEVTDIGRAEHQQDARGIPAESEVPVLNRAVQLPVQIQATNRRLTLVVDVFQREDDVRPRLSRKWCPFHLDHRPLIEGYVGPLNVVRVPNGKQRA